MAGGGGERPWGGPATRDPRSAGPPLGASGEGSSGGCLAAPHSDPTRGKTKRMTHIDIFQNHFKAVLPELFFVTAITVILIYAVAYNPSAKYRFPIMTNSVG